MAHRAPASAIARHGLALAVIVLVVLHVFAPQPQGDPFFGAWPWDLVYPLVWMAAAAGAIIVMTGKVWRDPEDEG